jgi:hypothetical protein
MADRAEDIAAFHVHSGRPDLVAPPGVPFNKQPDHRSIWDLKDPTGPAEIWAHATRAKEMIERDPARYCFGLPDGVQPGPKSGPARRIVL